MSHSPTASSLQSPSDNEGWLLFGKVINLCIYPLEGGGKIEVKKAACKRDGLHGNGLSNRSFMIFNPSANNAVLLYINHRNISEINEMLYSLEGEMDHDVLQPDLTIDYLGEPISVVDQSSTKWAKDILKRLDMEHCGLAYFPFQQKCEFLEKRRTAGQGNINNTFLANFHPYMLLNAHSYNFTSFLKHSMIYHLYRPNLIISPSSEASHRCRTTFCEDLFECVKIRNVVFRNLSPCTHNDTLNVESGEPLNTLKRIRPCKKIHLQYPNVDLPVFGINVGLRDKEDPSVEIEKDDEVFVKFKVSDDVFKKPAPKECKLITKRRKSLH